MPRYDENKKSILSLGKLPSPFLINVCYLTQSYLTFPLVKNWCFNWYFLESINCYINIDEQKQLNVGGVLKTPNERPHKIFYLHAKNNFHKHAFMCSQKVQQT